MTGDSHLDRLHSLITLADPRSQSAEAYRTLATNLQLSRVDGPLRTILFTSAAPDDGKTTTLANLGVTVARGGRSAILVDCDLRRPGLHEVFSLANDTGVSTCLQENASLERALQATGIPGLRVLTSGPPPPSPADILGTEAAAQLLRSLAAQADLVLIDAPPVTRVADASILAPRVDGVVLVIAAMRTRREDALQAKTQLERVHANVLGVILNNARVDRNAFRY